jgi:pyridoxal phosphate enzyme (YggS family)
MSVEERIRGNLETIRRRIDEAAARAGRDGATVRIVAVTKRQPLEMLPCLVKVGLHDLGENYPQALWARADALSGLPIRWHHIGHLQSNKVKRMFPLVRWIHGVDSLKLLRLLDELAMAAEDPPHVCLQVNCSGEPTKHGWSPASILADADAIAQCRHIPVAGLMTMAAPSDNPESARPAFESLRELGEELRRRTRLSLPELSMGMSDDYEIAVEEGATWVRIGSALFEGVGT